jgi:hypothetical protein
MSKQSQSDGMHSVGSLAANRIKPSLPRRPYVSPLQGGSLHWLAWVFDFSVTRHKVHRNADIANVAVDGECRVGRARVLTVSPVRMSFSQATSANACPQRPGRTDEVVVTPPTSKVHT